MNLPEANLDFETRSIVDLPKVGAHRYAMHPGTKVLCMAWSIGTDGPYLWWPWEEFPQALRQHILLGGIVNAWNAQFERLIWPIMERNHGAPPVPLEQWRCTMVRAFLQGFPGKLEHAGPSMGLGECKDAAGHRIMLQVSKPRKVIRPRDKGYKEAKAAAEYATAMGVLIPEFELWHDQGELRVYQWWVDNARMGALGEYCLQDVATERAAGWFLDPMPELELAGWRLDQKINDRGFYVDMDLVEKAQQLVPLAIKRANERLKHITGGELLSVTQPNEIRAWLNRRLGLNLASIDKDTLNLLLVEHPDLNDKGFGDRVAIEVIELRLAGAKTSTAKLNTLRRMVGEDRLLRGGLQYAGAGRTNRFAGRGFQPHNIPRPPKWAVRAVDFVMRQAVRHIELLFGQALEAISAILRSCITARPGNELTVADYNAIEARFTAWLAGDEEILDAYRRGDDVYRIMAAKVFGIPDWRDIDKESMERFLGKQLILGCFGADTLVLTQRGWVPIVELCGTDLVWDGEEWVCHQGVVYRGLRKTLKLCGVCVTPDHLVWSGTQWLEAGSLAQDADTLSRALEHAAGNLPSPDTYAGPVEGSPHSSSSATAAGPSTRSTLTISRTSDQHGATHVPSKHRPGSDSGSMPRSCPTTTTAPVSLTGSRPPSPGATTPSASHISTMEAGGFASTPSGLLTEAHFCGMSRLSTDGTTQVGRSTGLIPTRGMNQATSDSQHAAKTCRTEEKSMTCSGKLPVYDVSYAGPRNRYTIWTDSGPLLVHNCGYGMGDRKFWESCRDDGLFIEKDLAKTAVQTYRKYPDGSPRAIPKAWYELEDAAIQAVLNPGQWFPCLEDKIWFYKDTNFLRLRLPSGRLLSYLAPRVTDDVTPWGAPAKKLWFWGWNGQKNRMEWQSLYGGRIMENASQAGSRDVLLDAMLRLDADGWFLILTVHDEILSDNPIGTKALQKMLDIMAQTPPWAAGLPLKAEGWQGHRYRK